MAVRRPAAEDDAVNAERTYRQNKKQADVEIGDLKCRAKRQRSIRQ